MLDDQDVTYSQVLAGSSQSVDKFVRDGRARRDLVRESDRDQSNLGNFARLWHRVRRNVADSVYTASGSAASTRSGKFQLLARRWARVWPGSDSNCCKSGGLSTSTAIPGSLRIMHAFPVASAAARWGLKLSL